MDNPMIALRSAIVANLADQLELRTEDGEPTTEVAAAKTLRFPPTPGISEDDFEIPLDNETLYEAKIGDAKSFMTLRSVYCVYLYRNMNVVDYIKLTQSLGIQTLKFVERTDLLTWLKGAQAALQGLSDTKKTEDAAASTSTTSTTKKRKREVDEETQKIYDQEQIIRDHNSALRGSKDIDFSSVARECKTKIIEELKQADKLPAKDAAATRNQQPGRRELPIIIISPSASALVNRANIKEFLEQGSFNGNAESFVSQPDLQYIERASPRVGGKMRFIVVDNVTKFKPDYWNRVVGVFVTGQAWQLKSYMWADPNELFRRVPGFAVLYKGDPTPSTLQTWNVEKYHVERRERFKDREVTEKIWERLESSALKRGFKGKR